MIAPADYIFTLEEIDGNTGLYDILGVTADEATVEGFLDDSTFVKRVQVFTLGLLEGPIQTITSIDEFMEFQR